MHGQTQIKFPELSHKRHDFRGGGGFIENKMCVLISSKISCKKSLIPRRIQQDIINVYWSLREAPVILINFHSNLNFLDRFWTNNQRSNFIKILPVGAEFYDAANSRFS